MSRDWSAARAKVREEGQCRVCGGVSQLEAAHTIARSLGGGQSAASIIPLCSACHRASHRKAFDLLGYLTPEEQVEAVRVAGSIERARRHLAPTDYTPDMDEARRRQNMRAVA